MDYVFLEEDEDTSLFIRTLKEIGCPYKIVSHYADKLSKIRKYQSFSEHMKSKVEVEFV